LTVKTTFGDWNPILTAQLTAILEAKLGPVFGPENEDEDKLGAAPIKCGEADTPIYGDFAPVKAYGDPEAPIMGEPMDNPIYGDADAPIMLGDFSPTLILGGDFGPSYGDPEGPIYGDFAPAHYVGDFAPVLGDWPPSKAEHMRIVRLRPFIPPAKCGEADAPIKYGEPSSPLCGDGVAPVTCELVTC
jgi:hypothetical protein